MECCATYPINKMRTSAKNQVIALSIIAGLGGIVLRVFDPATAGLFPPCPVHYLTGWYCPGCGSLRAIHALLHGNFLQAWAMNSLTMVLLPFLIYGLISEALSWTKGRGLPKPTFSPRQIHGLFAVIILFGVLRNLPLRPFALLAPGAMLHL